MPTIRLTEFNRQVNVAIPYLTAQNTRLLVPSKGESGPLSNPINTVIPN